MNMQSKRERAAHLLALLVLLGLRCLHRKLLRKHERIFTLSAAGLSAQDRASKLAANSIQTMKPQEDYVRIMDNRSQRRTSTHEVKFLLAVARYQRNIKHRPSERQDLDVDRQPRTQRTTRRRSCRRPAD